MTPSTDQASAGWRMFKGFSDDVMLKRDRPSWPHWCKMQTHNTRTTLPSTHTHIHARTPELQIENHLLTVLLAALFSQNIGSYLTLSCMKYLPQCQNQVPPCREGLLNSNRHLNSLLSKCKTAWNYFTSFCISVTLQKNILEFAKQRKYQHHLQQRRFSCQHPSLLLRSLNERDGKGNWNEMVKEKPTKE